MSICELWLEADQETQEEESHQGGSFQLQTPARIFEFFGGFPDVFFRCFFSGLLDTFGKFGAQLGWLLSPKVNHHPERGANQVELEIIQIRDSKS